MMMKLCLMASLGNPSGFGMSRVIKDCEPLLPSLRIGQDTARTGSVSLRPHLFEEPWKPVSGLLKSNQFVKIDSTIRSPMLIDMQVQDARPSSVLFSYGIAEHCTRRDKILQYLMSGSSEGEKGGLDLSLLSDLMGLQLVTNDVHQLQFVPPLNHPSSELDTQKPLVDFMGDLVRDSKIMVHPDGRVLLTGTGSEMKDLLSLVTEFYSPKDSTMFEKQSLLVPYFNRPDFRERKAVAPLKSPEKIKLKPSQKKNSRKLGRERDLYEKNSSHACENLLSLMVDRRRHGKTAILSLKKCGPELPELLTKFAAGIAGTGLAVLFSVICRVACGRVAFCSSKLFNTGFGFGLVWLSWAVNRLRDTIVCISRNSSKLGLKEEEMMTKVERSVKEIYFPAATLMAIAFLKFA